MYPLQPSVPAEQVPAVHVPVFVCVDEFMGHCSFEQTVLSG